MVFNIAGDQATQKQEEACKAGIEQGQALKGMLIG
jgi:hypothetical protein